MIIPASENGKDPSLAFQRRCVLRDIRLPDGETLRGIVRVHFPRIRKRLLPAAQAQVLELREVPVPEKPPTPEALDRLRLVLVEALAPGTRR